MVCTKESLRVRSRASRGFTLIELLVVIAIIAVLIALLLPAVQAAREAARRSQCVNNMKQLGLAIANYSSSNSSFPMGGIPITDYSKNPPQLTSWGGWSGQATMLPFLEQTAIYNSINFSTPCLNSAGTGAEGNSTAVITKVNAFLCPSSLPFPGTSQPIQNGANYPSPGNNYFLSGGSSMSVFAAGNFGMYATSSAAPNGPFQHGGSAFSERDVIDGTSNTIAVGEWRSGDNNNKKFTNPQDMIISTTQPSGASPRDYGGNTGIYTVMPLGGAILNTWLAQCAGLAQPAGTVPTHYSYIGELWAEGLMSRGMGNVVVPPNSQYPNCLYSFGGGDTDDDYGNVGLSSYHPGGANVAFCDGSVHFLKNTISQLTIWQLASRAQGEVISADAY